MGLTVGREAKRGPCGLLLGGAQLWWGRSRDSFTLSAMITCALFLLAQVNFETILLPNHLNIRVGTGGCACELADSSLNPLMAVNIQLLVWQLLQSGSANLAKMFACSARFARRGALARLVKSFLVSDLARVAIPVSGPFHHQFVILKYSNLQILKWKILFK